MSRYVDIEPYEKCVLQRHYRNSMGECIKTIPLCGLPIADVQEVRHGRWIAEDNDGSWSSAVCSVCGRRVGLAHYETDFVKHFPYCHCGARMEGEEE